MTRTRSIAILGIVLAAGLAAATPAAADIRGTVFAGTTRIEETNKGTFGAAVTFGGLLGVEFEAARTLLGDLASVGPADVEASLTTYMGNLVLRLPTGPIQPYGSAGVGVVRVTGDINVPFLGDVVSASAQDVGWNVGGGVYLFPTPNIGLRAEVRRFQTGDVNWEDIADIGDLPLPKFNFWRATAGVTIKF
ncbi:MAG: outer membrane protein [Vicinamibacterales bacterium]